MAAGALLSLALPGCGGGAKTKSVEVDAAHLRVARDIRGLTFQVERAVEHLPGGAQRIARKFRSLAGSVDYRATYLQTVSGLGPVEAKAFVLQHSLLIYEAPLRAVAKHAGRGDRSLTRFFRGIRHAGAEVRANDAAWERVLRAKAADF